SPSTRRPTFCPSVRGLRPNCCTEHSFLAVWAAVRGEAIETRRPSRLRKNWRPARLSSRRGEDGAGRGVRRARAGGKGWEAGGDVQLRLARTTDPGRPSAAADPGHDRRRAAAALAAVRRTLPSDRPTLDCPGETAPGAPASGPLLGPQ